MTRVVVVDDQAVVREGLVLLLGLLPGIEVVGSAGDGEAALRLVAAERPDVALMDLRMPRMDGVEATGRIRAAYPETQVVVLTTYSDDESVFAALRAGARGFLTKDAEADDIASAVAAVTRGDAQLDPTVQRRLLDSMAPAPSAPATPAPPPPPRTAGTAPTSPPPPADAPSPAGDRDAGRPPKSPGNPPHGREPASSPTGPPHGQGPASSPTGAPYDQEPASAPTGPPQDREPALSRPARAREPAASPNGLTPRESEVLVLIAEGLSNAEIAGRLYITEATVKTHINNLFAKAHLRDRAQAVTYAYRHGLAHPG